MYIYIYIYMFIRSHTCVYTRIKRLRARWAPAGIPGPLWTPQRSCGRFWALVGQAFVRSPGPLWAPWALVGWALVGLPGPSWPPPGPCGPGRCGPPWALAGRALVGPPGPLRAEPLGAHFLWPPLGSYRPGPYRPPGPLWARPLWAFLGPHGPCPYGPHGPLWAGPLWAGPSCLPGPFFFFFPPACWSKLVNVSSS